LRHHRTARVRRTPTRRWGVAPRRARRDERTRLERAGVGYVELVTHADEKRALDDGDGLIRRMEVGRKLIAGRHVEAHGEERALTRIPLQHRQLGTRRKRRRRWTPFPRRRRLSDCGVDQQSRQGGDERRRAHGDLRGKSRATCRARQYKLRPVEGSLKPPRTADGAAGAPGTPRRGGSETAPPRAADSPGA